MWNPMFVFSNALADSFNGASVFGAGEDAVEGVTLVSYAVIVVGEG